MEKNDAHCLGREAQQQLHDQAIRLRLRGRTLEEIAEI
jgi:alkyl sulfatase BDS1-like metallo-beta-lactamase superfamily hydrolase